MKIEIDQSGRVEYTSHKTVIADSLGNAVYVTTSTKKIIQQLYRKAGKPRVFVYELFALLISLLIKTSYNKIHRYLIDTEYPGMSEFIKRYILCFSSKINPKLNPDQISFGSIKEGSISDKIAHEEFLKIKNAKRISLETLLKFLLQ